MSYNEAEVACLEAELIVALEFYRLCIEDVKELGEC